MGARARTTTGRPRAGRRGILAFAVASLALLGAGCSTAPPKTSPTPLSSTVPSSTAANTPPASTTYTLYFLRGSYLGVAHRAGPATTSIATATLTTLLGGPSSSEVSAGLSSAIPPATRLLGIRIASGTATVDFTREFGTPGTPGNELARVAQVVFTMSQFPSVKRVAFEISGATPSSFGSGAVSLQKPRGETDVLGALPAILVETPAVGDSLHRSVHLSGLANVYEAQFNVQLVDGAGKVLLDAPVHATAGSGEWGSFDVTFPFSAQTTSMSTLRVYDISMRDGSPIDEVDLHLPAAP